MIMDDLTLLVQIAAIGLAAGFIHSAIGFGFGIVAVTLLPLVLDVHLAHIIISTAGVPVLLMAAWTYRKGADWPSLWRAIVGAAICLPLGQFAFEGLSGDLLVRGTGIAILVMVWISFHNRRLAAGSEPKRDGSAWLAGAIGGFLAGAVSIAGPPIAAFALGQGWEQARFKSFLNQFLVFVSIYRVAGLAVRGYVDQPILLHAALLAPVAIVGIQIGAIASRRLSTQLFQRCVATCLITIACYFVIRGAP
ncbi:sulfite exporter TauE/SafE family protein [Stieleria sp. TO1_6]|uniref:sulfite exporter TauE/SafE family protein n=1 Tax=Stieleria tagensis TaxID=2956795 RepID=UPI00209AB63F|nr:sulfite exporter TauE/SafE family protein [Stieleria tagensis]MCO8120619.1 sulfite exporter TauE/SafE family protein [Stieleria tagensis]